MFRVAQVLMQLLTVKAVTPFQLERSKREYVRVFCNFAVADITQAQFGEIC